MTARFVIKNILTNSDGFIRKQHINRVIFGQSFILRKRMFYIMKMSECNFLTYARVQYINCALKPETKCSAVS